MSLDRIPPVAVEEERAALGSVLIDRMTVAGD